MKNIHVAPKLKGLTEMSKGKKQLLTIYLIGNGQFPSRKAFVFLPKLYATRYPVCTSRLNCSIRHSARIFSALPIIPCLLKRAFVSAWRGGANFYTKNIKPISHNSNKTFNEMNFDSSTLLEKNGGKLTFLRCNFKLLFVFESFPMV